MRITGTGTILQNGTSGRVLGLQMIPKDCRPMLALDTLAASVAAKDALPALAEHVVCVGGVSLEDLVQVYVTKTPVAGSTPFLARILRFSRTFAEQK